MAEQIYIHGFVHCDPVRIKQDRPSILCPHSISQHPGNLFIRKTPEEQILEGKKTPFQVVILDHGLYRELSDEVWLLFLGAICCFLSYL